VARRLTAPLPPQPPHEALATFGAVSSTPTSDKSPLSTSAPSVVPGTGPAVNPSRTGSSAAPASTSDKPNAGDVRYGEGYGARALFLSVVAALSVVC
jgi:hypothetical protein